jgi:hypothetical protein
MNRIILLAFCTMLFALCFAASAQQPEKVRRIGYLSASDPANESIPAGAIRLALRAFGCIEGQKANRPDDSTERLGACGSGDALRREP